MPDQDIPLYQQYLRFLLSVLAAAWKLVVNSVGSFILVSVVTYSSDSFLYLVEAGLLVIEDNDAFLGGFVPCNGLNTGKSLDGLLNTVLAHVAFTVGEESLSDGLSIDGE